jgi:dipeptidase D
MPVLEQLQPREVFHFFEEISQIPRATFDTKAVSDYCVAFAKERGLEVHQDEWNNVIIKKAATAGYENAEPVILQGHLDMVCEKTEQSTHDFSKDPLQLYVEDGWVKAKDTTLGADNGIAVAMALAVLDATDLMHPALEVILTVDEEVGMTGAETVDMSFIEGNLLINLDSEDEDTIIAGCAGGVRFQMNVPLSRVRTEGALMHLNIRGLRSGHSGAEIDQQRGNAIKLAGRLLHHLDLATEISLVDIQGGTKDNVIPAACKMSFLAKDTAKVIELTKEMQEIWREEFGQDEPDLEIVIEKKGWDTVSAFSPEASKRIIFFLMGCPNGVYEYHRTLKGLVETSQNLGIVKIENEQFQATFLIRSSVATKCEELKEILIGWTNVMGGTYELSGEYPAWAYKKDSKIRDIVARVYEASLGRKPIITTIHAGLECGLLTGKKPTLDCVSIGPNMHDIHSVKERLEVASTQRVWNCLKEILKQCK